VLVLGRDVTEDPFADRVQLAVGVEEPDDAFGLLKGLNQTVQQDAIEAAIAEPDTILMMLVEGVHGCPPGVATRQDKPMNAATGSWQYSGSSSVRSRSRITVAPREARQSRQRELAKGKPFTGVTHFTRISRAAPLASSYD
jgi:hypothetical protein